MECFECDGTYVEVTKDYSTEDSNGKNYVVPFVTHLICNKCNNTCISGKVSKQITNSLKQQGFPFRDRKPIRQSKL